LISGSSYKLLQGVEFFYFLMRRLLEFRKVQSWELRLSVLVMIALWILKQLIFNVL